MSVERCCSLAMTACCSSKTSAFSSAPESLAPPPSWTWAFPGLRLPVDDVKSTEAPSLHERGAGDSDSSFLNAASPATAVPFVVRAEKPEAEARAEAGAKEEAVVEATTRRGVGPLPLALDVVVDVMPVVETKEGRSSDSAQKTPGSRGAGELG